VDVPFRWLQSGPKILTARSTSSNRTIVDVTSGDKSFELRDGFAASAMEGNAC